MEVIACETVNKGGTIIILGVSNEDAPIPMAIVNEHELTIKGSMMYQHKDYEQVVKWIADGKLITKPLVTKEFPFEQYADAYKFIDKHSREIMKVMINLNWIVAFHHRIFHPLCWNDLEEWPIN